MPWIEISLDHPMALLSNIGQMSVPLSPFKIVLFMKKILFSLLLAAVAASLALPACKKDDLDCPPDLPCATQTGANTFGCYINGEPWVAEIAPYVLDPTLHKIEAEYDEDGYGSNYDNLLSIKGHKTNDSTDGFISINLKPVRSVGEISHTNMISFEVSALIVTTNKGQFINAVGFNLDTYYDYSIEITHLDTAKNIISGTFYFTGTSPKDTVKVTKGRFDIKYK
jgi:hypothetical protein